MSEDQTEGDVFVLEIDGVVKQVPMPKWKYVGGGVFGKEAHRVYRDETLKAQCEVVTRRNVYGEWGEGEVGYFLDDDKREFETVDAMLRALCEGPRNLFVYRGTTRRPNGGSDSKT